MEVENSFKRLSQFETLSDLLDFFSSEQKCVDYLEKILWNNKPVSPFDPTSKVWECANNQYMCKNTGKRFNIRKGTIFENSKISLRNWFISLFLLYSNKKGISSLQLPKYFKTTQKLLDLSSTVDEMFVIFHYLKRCLEELLKLMKLM